MRSSFDFLLLFCQNRADTVVKKENAKLLESIENFCGRSIMVWGDFILDEYLYGNTKRVSREAPVLILSYKDTQFSLGGAGNALLNLKSLGADPLPVGIVGHDDAGQQVLKIIEQNDISTEYIIIDKAVQTPIKTRILAGEETAKKQQILRIDREDKVPDSISLKRKIEDSLRQAGAQTQSLLISDYNYNTVKIDIFDRILPELQKRNISIGLDSRFRLLKFHGITFATPNEPEVENALNLDHHDDGTDLEVAGRHLLETTRSQSILITRGSRGMTLFERNEDPLHIPIYGTTDIVDGTGAGDTVISVFILALASGARFREAARLANIAGGIVVMKKGTSTLTTEELGRAILASN